MCIATCPCVKKGTIAKLLGRGGPLLLLITPCRFDPFGPRRPVGVTGPLVFPCSRPGSRRLPPALLLPSFLLLRLPAVLLLRHPSQAQLSSRCSVFQSSSFHSSSFSSSAVQSSSRECQDAFTPGCHHSSVSCGETGYIQDSYNYSICI